VDALLQRPLTEPQDGLQYVLVEGYWIARGTEPISADQSWDYILTESVRANLRDLARVVSAGYVVSVFIFSIFFFCFERSAFCELNSYINKQKCLVPEHVLLSISE